MGRSFELCEHEESNHAHTSAQNNAQPSALYAEDGAGAERIITLACDINELSIATAMTHLMLFAQQSSALPVHMIVNTYGGSTDEMFALYDMMKFVKCPIYTVGLGKIMSAGVLLLSAGEKGHRRIGSNARVMMHPISSLTRGTVFNHDNELTEMKRIQKQMEACLTKETSLSKKQIKKLMAKNSDTYITANEAIEYGIVDSLI